jgi:hypothetical protein
MEAQGVGPEFKPQYHTHTHTHTHTQSRKLAVQGQPQQKGETLAGLQIGVQTLVLPKKKVIIIK